MEVLEVQDQVKQELAYLESTIQFLIEFCLRYGFQIIGALIILIIGYLFARTAGRFVVRLVGKWKPDETIAHFLGALVQAVFMVFIAIMALNKFGITMTPIVAAIGGMVFGGSFALQGLLSNFASGLFLIFTRPFLVGDTLSVQDKSGVVEKITMAYTLLRNENLELVSIPNHQVVGEIFHNSKEYRLAEADFSISIHSDPEKAMQAVEAALQTCDAMSPKHPPEFGIAAFGEFSIRIALRYWIPTRDFFPIQYRLNRELYRLLKEANIEFPIAPHSIQIKKS